MFLILLSCLFISFVYFNSTFAMGLFTDIRKKWTGTPSIGLDGYGERSTTPRAKSRGANRSQSQHRRPRGLDAGSESQDSGVVIVQKDSNVTLTKVPDHSCPNCAAAAVATASSRTNLSRPSMDRMRSFSSSKQQPMSNLGHVHEHPRLADAGHDHSRPGTGYSNQSGLPAMQQHHHHHQQHHDNGFSSRPLSWGRRATTENVGQDGPAGYTRPVTPPYSIRSEQTGWNSGQQYNNMYGHVPGPASHDGDFSQRPTSWRRATSSHLNYNPDQMQPRSFANTSQSSRTPSEAGSAHPRNASKNMENTAYEAGYRDAIARLRADADRW